MIPYGDSLHSRSIPLVNYTLIVINLLVFIYELMLQGQGVSLGLRQLGFTSELDVWINQWGTVPCRLAGSCPARSVVLESGAGNEWVNLITAQFIHAGPVHIAGNMLFLWLFGDNIEDTMGHIRYLLFYLLGGIIAGLAHVYADPNSPVPAVGASGAIAAVMGAYLVTYPRASVQVVIPIGFFPFFTRLPAFLMMGLWFLTQLVGVGAMADVKGGGGGVAYWAHIGGFVAGMVLVWFFRGRRRSIDREERYIQYRWR